MDYNQIKRELQIITNEKIRLNTLKEQAEQQCKALETKYNVITEDDFRKLVDKANEDYENALKDAETFITNAKSVLEPYQGLV